MNVFADAFVTLNSVKVTRIFGRVHQTVVWGI